ELVAHLAPGYRLGQLEDAVGERRLAVVDVRDDREVADLALVHGPARRYRSPEPIERRGLSSRTPRSRQTPRYTAVPTPSATSSETIGAPIERRRAESSHIQTACATTASAPDAIRTRTVEWTVSVSSMRPILRRSRCRSTTTATMLQSEVDSEMPHAPSG